MHSAKPSSGAQMSTRLVRPFLTLLSERGVSIDIAALNTSGVSLDAPEGRIPHEVAMRLLSSAVNGLGDESLGLHAAEMIEPSNFDVLEYAGVASGRLGEAIEAVNRYVRLMHDAADFKLVHREQPSHLALQNALGKFDSPRAAAEFVAALFVVVGRRIVGRELLPLEVRFQHVAPQDPSTHQRVFGCPVIFEAQDNALVFDTDTLELPMPKADPALKALLERTAQQMLERLPRTDRWSDRVREVVASSLPEGAPVLETVAERLEITPRTLRRRLSDEDTTYSGLVEDLRRDLAKSYLKERTLAVSQVAFLLGFSEPSAFHKAFKRWMGVSPAGFRANAAGRTPGTTPGGATSSS